MAYQDQALIEHYRYKKLMKTPLSPLEEYWSYDFDMDGLVLTDPEPFVYNYRTLPEANMYNLI